jgi:beta-glucosidase
MTKPKIRFPKRFMWGAATSAHQVEGGLHNQWSIWETENANSLAARAPYHYGDSDSWSHVKTMAVNPNNYISGRAVDHFNRYEEDFDLINKLHLDSFRFSIEWSRIEPEEGRWDPAAIEHYREYLKQLEARKITPVVTLFHFTLPVWFSELGGFEKRSNLKYFQRFVEKVITELGSHFRYVITINEPNIYAEQSYLHGRWPPAAQSKRRTFAVLNNLITAHNRAARYIRQASRKYQVSMAFHVSHVYPGDDAWLTEASAKVIDFTKHHYVLKRCIKTCTYIGLNYYASDRVYGYRIHNPNQHLSDLDWDMQPSDIRYVLEDLADRYNKPILITENGLADGEDRYRKWWISQTIMAIHQAMQNGVPVIGYLHWSLLDNFEWDKGFWPRFGLVSVNRVTMERTIRESAKYYATVVANLKKGAN